MKYFRYPLDLGNTDNFLLEDCHWKLLLSILKTLEYKEKKKISFENLIYFNEDKFI